MKPRGLFSNGVMRVVRVQGWPEFLLEERNGSDAMNRGIWRRVHGPEGAEPVVRAIVRAFGESMVRREKAMRKARRGRK